MIWIEHLVQLTGFSAWLGVDAAFWAGMAVVAAVVAVMNGVAWSMGARPLPDKKS